MLTLAARLAVSAAGAVVVMTGVEALRLRSPVTIAGPRPPVEADADTPVPAPRLVVASAATAEPARPRAPRASSLLVMARVHGRVVGKAGGPGEVVLKIGDRARLYEPKVDPDGTFEMNLPPGSYRILATSGSQVAAGDVEDLAEEEDREVTLLLAEGGTIAGRVEGCGRSCTDVAIRAEVPGTRLVASSAQGDERGAFAVESLVAGRSYDLVFEAVGRRRLVMHGISAPREGLVAAFQPAPTLTGGFGLEPGQDCPMERVELEVAGEEGGVLQSGFDRACRFRVEGLPDAESVHLRASGRGWHFALDVPLPAHGDPPFLCLHPSCRDSAPEPTASLEIVYSGGSPREMAVEAEYPELGGFVGTSCAPSAGRCVLEELRSGTGLTVHVRAAGCEAKQITTTLLPGANAVNFTCEGVRPIRGLFRASLERSAGIRAQVRCSNDRPSRPARGLLFWLQCPERQSTIEYQLAPDGPWRTAALAPGGPGPAGVVEIEVE